MPLFLRVCIWGIVAGLIAIMLYKVTSNQAKITTLKKDIKTILNQLLKEDNDESEFFSLTMKNLKYSFKLVVFSFIPAFLSTIPVIIIMLCVQTYHSYALPEGNGRILVTTTPEVESIKVEPAKIVKTTSKNNIKIVPSKETITITIKDEPVFEGNVFDPPVSIIEKYQWWNILIGNPAGYISNSAPIEAITFHFKRKKLFNSPTNWVNGWELTFFLSVFVSTLLAKIILKIQ